jgi:hypothetical protein
MEARMPEKDDRNEKTTRTSVGIGNTEIDRETKTKSSDTSSYSGGEAGGDRDRYGADRDRYGADRDRYSADRDRYGRDRYPEGPYDDDQYDDSERARRGARELGDSFRDTTRTVRRESTNILTAGCDLIGGFFIGIGEAISPRGRSGGGSQAGSSCAPISQCSGGGEQQGFNEPPRGRYNEPPRSGYNEPPRSGYNEPPRSYGPRQSAGGGSQRVSTTRTEVKRTNAR